MANAFIRIDLPDRSPDFQRMALEPGVPLLDRGQTTARLLRVWLGRFVGEPEWIDNQTVQFYLIDDQGRRITPRDLRLVSSEDLKGPLRGELQSLKQKLAQAQPRGRTEQAVFKILGDRLAALEQLPEHAFSDGVLFQYRDSSGARKLVWCWGYQRSESKIVQPVICVKPDCARVYLLRNPGEPKCSKCQTPMPVYRFPWRRVGLIAACLLLIAAAGGWRYWSTLPRSTISGQIVWSGFNVPVAGAEVRVEGVDAVARSDQDGRFRLDHLPAGTLLLVATADGFRKLSTSQHVGHAQEMTVPIEMVGDGVLQGRVIDAISRQPLPKVTLQIVGTSETLTTDDKGEFHREGCRAGKSTLLVNARGYPTVEREVSTSAGDGASVDVEVTGKAILVGRVISAAQESPMADVTVRLEGCGQTTRTDAEGWYVFRNAPAGQQEIVVACDGYATERAEKELIEAQERQASFKLAGAAKVVGTVLRAADMSPMSGVEIKVVGTKFTTKTDDDGKFTLGGVTAGKATIDASLAGYASASFERVLSNTEETVLPITLRGDAAIVGEVIDESTKQPLADIHVRLVGLPYQTRTDAKGKYRLDAIPSLPARLDARAAGYIAKTVDVRPVTKEDTPVSLTLQGNSTLSGLITEKWSGKPLEKARLTLGKTGFELLTNEDGAFEIRGVRGGVSHEFQISADGLPLHTERFDARPGPAAQLKIVMSGVGKLSGQVVSVIDESPIAGAKVQLLGTSHEVTTDTQGQFQLDQLRMAPTSLEFSATGFHSRRVTEELTTDFKPVKVLLGGNASVVGEIVDGTTGQPIEGAEVRIAKTALKARTSKQGEFHLPGAFPGPAAVTVDATGYPAKSMELELIAERESSVEIKLTGTASLAGEVYDDLGKPLANATVQWEDSDYQITTGARGEFQLNKLRGGPAKLNFHANKFARKTVPVELKSGETKPLGRLTLSSNLSLSGQVVNAITGEPLPNAKLSIAGMGLKTVCDAQGGFKFDGLPAKMHNIKVEAPGFVAELDAVNPMDGDGTGVFALCPPPKEDEVFIVVAWRGGTSDLDAHLYRAEDPAVRVCADHPQADNLSMVKLSQAGRGPETLRIGLSKPGRYEMLVQVAPVASNVKGGDVSEMQKELSRSEAIVKVYRHGQSEPTIYRVGRNKKATVWWPFALELTGSNKIIDHVYKAEHYRNSLPAAIAK